MSTASTNTSPPPRLDDLKEMERVMKELAPSAWMLLSPDGRAWKGKPEELLQVLMPHHPLLKGLS